MATARLRRVSCSGPGMTRRRHGKGFVYVDAGGARITDTTVRERIRALVIPPAWNDVWICPTASGHIQATGVDARGRRQYRYHDVWRLQRDLAKHDRILDFGSRLPAARERIRADLHGTELTRERVLACAVRLLDLGFFRIGGEQYAEENQTYGMATMRKEHVHVAKDGTLTFDYTAKSGKHLHKSLAEPEVGAVIAALKRRRGGGEELLAYRGAAGQWVDVKSGDINPYLRLVTDGAVIGDGMGLCSNSLKHAPPSVFAMAQARFKHHCRFADSRADQRPGAQGRADQAGMVLRTRQNAVVALALRVRLGGVRTQNALKHIV